MPAPSFSPEDSNPGGSNHFTSILQARHVILLTLFNGLDVCNEKKNAIPLVGIQRVSVVLP
jgi:hypothetical protein